MKRTLELDHEWDVNESRCEYTLRARIEHLKTKSEVRAAIEELFALGFGNFRIHDGAIRCDKATGSPYDLLDAKYDAYRYLARECED